LTARFSRLKIPGGVISETEGVMNIDELADRIRQWGEDRGILDNSSPLAQSRKTIEEVYELVAACAQIEEWHRLNRVLIDAEWYRFRKIEEDLTDAIGDVFVTLIMVAECAGLDIQQCVQAAYEEIKDRKGYLRADGVFVKEET
jgi:NTP pyrophosphatase (non-canonical NTP hydrolase)